MTQYVTVVSGLPRSGTSLMMQMLAAGGVPVLTDGVRTPDEDNPHGYLEFEPVKRTRHDPSWVAGAAGKAVKMVYLLLRDLPGGYEYRVIMMRRNLMEVVASQQKMLARSGKTGAQVSAEKLEEIFAGQMKSIAEWLAAQPNFRVLDVDYRDCVEAAPSVAARVSRFLQNELNLPAMAGVIDTGLYRNRRGPAAGAGP